MTIVVASENFSRGYVSDVARDQLPAGSAYRMKDWIPSLDARLRGRGGWQYTSPDLSTVFAGLTSVVAVAWAPFLGDEHLIAIGNNGSVYRDNHLDGVTASVLATAVLPNVSHPPFWCKDLVDVSTTGSVVSGGIIIPAPYGTGSLVVGVYKYYLSATGTYSVALLGGTPPQAYVGANFGDYLLLANGQAAAGPGQTKYPNRIWVSAVGNPESWTPGTNFWDSSIPNIVALVPLRAGILVFGFANANIISGDIPPAGGNWSEAEAFGGIGCFDARSIAKFGEYVCFANNNGAYMTDGITLTDLTQESGVKQRWKSLVGTFDFTTGWTAAGGVYRNYYVITVHDNAGAFVTCHVFDLMHGIAFEFTNIRANMFAHSALSEGTALISGEERLFMAPKNNLHVEGLHKCWTAPDTMVDGDGANVLPQIETPYYTFGRPGKKVFRSTRATYDVRSSGGSTPTLSVDYCTTPGGAYTNAGSLPQTTDEDRQRVDVRTRAVGLGLRLTQVGKSGHTTLSGIEVDQQALEGMR